MNKKMTRNIRNTKAKSDPEKTYRNSLGSGSNNGFRTTFYLPLAG